MTSSSTNRVAALCAAACLCAAPWLLASCGDARLRTTVDGSAAGLDGGATADASLDAGLSPEDAAPPPPYDAADCPGAADEACDGADEDCDGRVDEDVQAPACPLELGVCAGSTRRCGGAAGWIACSGIESYGGDYQAEESSCDGLDNDCDGDTDEGCDCSDGESRSCGVAIGECRAGTQLCAGGRWGACSSDEGTSEVCDGLDNDCDGASDDGLVAPSCALTQGVCAGSTRRCGGVSGWQACDASRYGANYQATESRCDGLDNDCDGAVDEGCGCSVPGTGCATSEICACPALASSCTDTGTCVPLSGDYSIRIESAALTTLDPAGECWDADCSAPDPFIEVYVGATHVGTTSARPNTRFPTWPPDSFRASVTVGGTLELRVYDEDFLVHDVAFVCSVGLTEPTLRARAFTCSAGAGSTVRGSLVPYP